MTNTTPPNALKMQMNPPSDTPRSVLGVQKGTTSAIEKGPSTALLDEARWRKENAFRSAQRDTLSPGTRGAR